MKTLSFLFLFFTVLGIKSQEPYTIHYTINDGLPTNTIYSTYHNLDGTTWFGSDVGLIKFDGKKFTLLNTEDGLTDNEIFHVKEDYKGRKWLLTLNGKPSFIYNNKIYNDQNSSIIKQIKSKSLLSNFFEVDSTIYISSRKGTISIINKKDSLISFNSYNSHTSGLWKFKDTLYTLNSDGIFNTQNNKLIKASFSKVPYRIFHHKKEVFYSNYNTLKKILFPTKTKTIVKLPKDAEIINIYIENVNRLWLCTRKGLFLYENNIIKGNYFKNKIVTSFSKDKNNNYWLTTLNSGVFLIPSLKIFQKELNINTIAKKNKNEIWFGGFKNDYYIKKGNTFKSYSLNKNLRKDAISRIRFSKNETYVIGKVGTMKIEQNNKHEISSNLNDLLITNDSLYLATSFTSLMGKSDFNLIDTKKVYEKIILQRRTNVLEKENSNIFLGTNVGLYKYLPNKKLVFLGDKNEDLKSSVNDLLFDKQNKFLLIATGSKGVLVVKKDSVFYEISTKDGLNNNSVNGVTKITNNEYLVATNKGINKIKFEKDNFSVENYNAYLGFNNTKINAVNFTNDTTYLAVDKKLIYFKNDEIKKIKPTPNILIDELYVNNKIIKHKELQQIDYRENSVKIEFNAISFLDKGNVDFYYRLNNGNWTRTRQREVNYRSLASNAYIFEVYCINKLNKKSEVKKIEFNILKPFWEKWWFLFFVSVCLIAVIIIAIRLRIKYLNKQFTKEKKTLLLERENIKLENQMLALEQKALRLQMNPHFIFNALNTIKGYYSEGNKQEASDYISNFSKLLRLLLENVDQYISLSTEIKMLNLYFQLTQVRYNYRFDYNIIVDEKLNTNEVLIPTLLVQPIIENAILHGISPKKSKGFVKLFFNKDGDDLLIIVEDNGIGRKESLKKRNRIYKSKALEITKERLELLENQEKRKCSIKFIDLIKNNECEGTKVIIKIPLLKNY
ncbi:MAG: histidine kinase [Polaribacter sp.]